MIIERRLIRKIVAEEIKNALALTKKLKKDRKPKGIDKLRKRLIKLFIKYRSIVEKNAVSEKENIMRQFNLEIEKIKNNYSVGLEGSDLHEFYISILIDHADPQLITFAKTFMNSDKARADKMDNYTMSITPEEEKYTPHNLPFRNLKTPEAYGNKVDDVRRFRRT